MRLRTKRTDYLLVARVSRITLAAIDRVALDRGLGETEPFLILHSRCLLKSLISVLQLIDYCNKSEGQLFGTNHKIKINRLQP